MKTSGDLYFDLFWSAYPKRVKRIQAFNEWKKLQDFTVKEILDGIERWKESAQWQDVQFIPDPERFLKYRRWEDEVPNRVPNRVPNLVDREGINRGPVLSDEARERLQKRLRLEGKIQ